MCTRINLTQKRICICMRIWLHLLAFQSAFWYNWQAKCSQMGTLWERHNCSHSGCRCCCCCCCPFAFAFLLQIWNRFHVCRVIWPTGCVGLGYNANIHVYLGQFVEWLWLRFIGPRNCVIRLWRCWHCTTTPPAPFLLRLLHLPTFVSNCDFETMLKFCRCTPHGVCAIFTFVSYRL